MKSYTLLIIALLAAAVYANSLGGEFVSDDRALILEHPYTKRLADWPAIFTSGHYAGEGGYRPITTLSFALNYAIGGESPVGYHLFNIILHALNSVLVALLLQRLFASKGIALAAALIFAVHPIHTEAVAWISGRAELLAAGFFLAAWLFHFRANEELASRWRILSWVSFFCAALSKENALLLPLALVAGDLAARKRISYPSLGIYATYGAVILLYFGFRWSLYHRALLRVAGKIAWTDNPLAHVGLWPRVLTALDIQGDYLRLLLWPVKLCADYSFDTVPIVTNPLAPGPLIATIALIALLAIATISFVRRTRVWFGIAFYLLALFPASNLLVTIGTIQAERLLYLPSIGFCALAAVGWDSLRRQRAIAISALAAIVVAGAARTWLRNPVWHNEETLWTTTAQTAPRNFKAQLLVGESRLRAGRIADAIAALREAQRIDPESEDVAINLAAAFLQAGRNVEAIALCREAIARNPNRAAFHVNLGLAYAASGDLARARPALERALELDPTNPAIHLNLGLALSQTGELESAIAHYRSATQFKPDYAEGWNALGAALLKGRQMDEARIALERAIALRPGYREALYNLQFLNQTP